MSRFHVEIPLRWADLDVYRHVNHARTVTLLEEARVELVSVSENIDETPSGLLLHGIMSSIAESTRATWPMRSSRGRCRRPRTAAPLAALQPAPKRAVHCRGSRSTHDRDRPGAWAADAVGV